MVELLHNKKIFINGQKKSPLLHIDQNMTQFIILKKIFFVPFKKVEFLFAFVAKQSFVEQNGAHFWHISSKTSWLAGIGLNLFVTHKIRNLDDPENFGFFLDHPDSGFYGSEINGGQFQLVKMFCWKCAKNELRFALQSFV